MCAGEPVPRGRGIAFRAAPADIFRASAAADIFCASAAADIFRATAAVAAVIFYNIINVFLTCN